MDPHEVAPILGMTANGVAALSYRAREGLRKAWLQAHINDDSASGECRWTISRIGEHARRSLGSRDSERIATHLATCAKCSIISEEVDEVGSRLAMVMIPLILGGVVGGAFLASFGTATGVAVAATIPAVPAGIGAGTAVASGAGLLGTATAPVAFIGTLAIAVAIGGAVVVLAPTVTAPQTSQASDSGSAVAPTEYKAAGGPSVALGADHPANVDPLGVGTTVDGVVGAVGGVLGGVVDGVVDPLLGTIPSAVASASITLSGHGVPGATVTAQAAGVVYATTTIAPNGSFSLTVNGLPQGTSSVQLSQALGGLLGQLGLNIPLSLDTGALGIVVNLLN
jgi:predicted phage tail protein